MVMTSYRPAVFSSARTAGLIHRQVAIQRSRVARATRAPDRLAPPYTTGEEFYSKHRVSRRLFRLPHSLSRVPLYPLYPLESPLDSPTHRRASSDPQRGISRILNRRQISGQFPSCSSAIVASFSISRRGDFSGIAWLFLVEIIKPSKGGRRLIRIKGSISPYRLHL